MFGVIIAVLITRPARWARIFPYGVRIALLDEWILLVVKTRWSQQEVWELTHVPYLPETSEAIGRYIHERVEAQSRFNVRAMLGGLLSAHRPTPDEQGAAAGIHHERVLARTRRLIHEAHTRSLPTVTYGRR
jgi:hypothetical protein